MKSPLETIFSWFNSLPEPVRGNLAYFCVLRLLPYDPLRRDQTGYLREWLDVTLDYSQHIGRAVSACGLIDYVMDELGDPSHWDKNENDQLNMLESDIPPDAKSAIIMVRRNRPKARAEWLDAAKKWLQLRASVLSYDALRGWEHEMRMRSQPDAP